MMKKKEILRQKKIEQRENMKRIKQEKLAEKQKILQEKKLKLEQMRAAKEAKRKQKDAMLNQINQSIDKNEGYAFKNFEKEKERHNQRFYQPKNQIFSEKMSMSANKKEHTFFNKTENLFEDESSDFLNFEPDFAFKKPFKSPSINKTNKLNADKTAFFCSDMDDDLSFRSPECLNKKEVFKKSEIKFQPLKSHALPTYNRSKP